MTVYVAKKAMSQLVFPLAPTSSHVSKLYHKSRGEVLHRNYKNKSPVALTNPTGFPLAIRSPNTVVLSLGGCQGCHGNQPFSLWQCLFQSTLLTANLAAYCLLGVHVY